MAAGKSPRKTMRPPAEAAAQALGALPQRLKQVQLNPRPRRFSLLYSSDDSSLSDLSDVGSQRRREKYKNPSRNNARGRRNLDNSEGKHGRLIEGSAIDSDSEDTESSEATGMQDNESEDDGEGDDSSSMSSSDDDVDFVRLTAERKKKTLQVLNAMKMGRASSKMPKGSAPLKTGGKTVPRTSRDKPQTPFSEHVERNSSDNDGTGLAFSFKEGDGIQLDSNKLMHTSSNEGTDEDLGEEVGDTAVVRKGKFPSFTNNTRVDQLNVPRPSESEESEYEFDQDAYFRTIEDDHEASAGVDTGLETGDDDMVILDEEEQNMMQELANDDNLSFDGSIHEDGEDPVDHDAEQKNSVEPLTAQKDEKEEDEYDDEIMSDFDMPFYEDPKFANLYYYDGSDQPLCLSTSLPLILNEEKRKKQEVKRSRHTERKERLKRSKSLKREHSATPDLGSEDYTFGLFFNSDAENKGAANTGIETALRRLSTTALDYSEHSSDDDEYENILLDIAHMPTDDDSEGGGDIDMDLADGGSDTDGQLDRDEDTSITNVFIDIDDLDPDAFYFHYGSSSEKGSSDYSENEKGPRKYSFTPPDGSTEAVLYVDNESTDEDDTLPPPNSRTRKIGTKAKEVVSASTVGLKPPKLGTWKTDAKPFSIIDGLSTKSLLPLMHEQQLLHAHDAPCQQGCGCLPAGSASDFDTGVEQEELTLKELLNMSELDDEEGQVSISGWYDNKPKVPLSAFRNKGVNMYQDEEYTLPIFSARKFPIGYVGSERTRRKIDKMKELQKKNDERRRKLRKRKKLLRLKRKQAMIAKQQALNGDELESLNMNNSRVPTPASEPLTEQAVDASTFLGDPIMAQDQTALALPSHDRRNSTKPMDLESINNLLARDSDDLVAGNDDSLTICAGDADMLASLTAPITYDENDHPGSGAALRRRQSIAEAAAGNLRFTKNGLFSESALADLDEIIGHTNGNGRIIELDEVLN
ncbi:AaceriAGR179Wp [[Ashbya] aceris (nom. inval.)]|nr:AaceriAGR179Wp [[Ashbya] aceris (nom. inval.)]